MHIVLARVRSFDVFFLWDRYCSTITFHTGFWKLAKRYITVIVQCLGGCLLFGNIRFRVGSWAIEGSLPSTRQNQRIKTGFVIIRAVLVQAVVMGGLGEGDNEQCIFQ